MYSPEVTACIANLSKLSGFEPIERNFAGTLITNDEGYVEALVAISGVQTERLQLGIFIGSGGVLSLLPDLPIDIAILVDRNTAVLDLNGLLISIVRESFNPNQVLRRLTSKKTRNNDPAIKGVVDIYEDLKLTKAFLTHEIREFGDLHWTNKKRFVEVKRALDDKPITPISADITNSDFASHLVTISADHNAEIAFANFTNVHHWVEPKTMDFIKEWPFAAIPQIMYSSHEGRLVGDWPKVHLVHSVEAYIQATKRDRRS